MPESKPIISMGIKEQKRSLLTNPKSKHYDATLAKRRAKEKARRKANAKRRSK